MLAVGTCLITVTGFYVVTTFTLSYVTGRFGVGGNVPLVGQLLAGASESVALLVFGSLADRIGTRAIALVSSGTLVLLPYPYFWLVNTGHSALIWLAMSSSLFTGAALLRSHWRFALGTLRDASALFRNFFWLPNGWLVWWCSCSTYLHSLGPLGWRSFVACRHLFSR